MRTRSIAGLAGRFALAGLAVAGMTGVAFAQQPAPKTKQAAPAAAAAAPAAAAGPAPSAWVKLCEKAPFMVAKDGKEVREDKEICLTHHEQLDANTGMVFVSAALRKIEGQDKQHFMVMVPLGVALVPGLKTAVYTQAQWAKLEGNEAIDNASIKPIDLKFTICHPVGCTAEIEASPEILQQLNEGGGMRILGINAAAQPVVLPVPLNGFKTALTGPAVDNKQFGEERAKVMDQIRKRQEQIIEEWKKQQQQQQGGQGAPAATGSTPAPAAPAAKKP